MPQRTPAGEATDDPVAKRPDVKTDVKNLELHHCDDPMFAHWQRAYHRQALLATTNVWS